MPYLDAIWDKRYRTPALILSTVAIFLTALFDWWTKPYVSFGFLYLFPIILMAGFLPRYLIALSGAVCAILSEMFSSLPPEQTLIRLGFETLAIAGCGLFVGELAQNRRLTMAAQERLRILVETSPAAIITLDERGFIELANSAATQLIAPRDGNLVGHPVAAFLPDLHHALRPEAGPQFRASMECRGHRDNGDRFTANIWFSTYNESSTSPKLAAIIGEVSDEGQIQERPAMFMDRTERIPLNSREMEVIRLLTQGMTNKAIGSKMGLPESTVKNIFQQLFTKLSVRSRSQLVRTALEEYRDLL
jgi:two-component system sensor kinase FixL